MESTVSLEILVWCICSRVLDVDLNISNGANEACMYAEGVEGDYKTM